MHHCRAYLDKRTETEAALQRFTVLQDGQICREELRQCLEALNEGTSVPPEEVEWVMLEAAAFGHGQAGREELLIAASSWYSHVSSAVHAQPNNSGSQCCSIA